MTARVVLPKPGWASEEGAEALHLVAVLAVGLDDLVQVSKHGVHLRGQDRA